MVDRTEVLHFRVTRREKELLDKLAEIEARGRAEMFRELLRQEAQRRGLWFQSERRLRVAA